MRDVTVCWTPPRRAIRTGEDSVLKSRTTQFNSQPCNLPAEMSRCAALGQPTNTPPLNPGNAAKVPNSANGATLKNLTVESPLPVPAMIDAGVSPVSDSAATRTPPVKPGPKAKKL